MVAAGYPVHAVMFPRLVLAGGVEVFDGPAWQSVDEIGSAPYRREPYVRVKLPDEVVDAKAARWSRTHVLLHWIPAPDAAPRNAWVPAQWVTRISRDESSWRAPYDLPA